MSECKNDRVPIIEFRGITKRFSGVTVLDHVSFEIQKGEVHCLMGENGAGKSTLIKILTGVYHADEGEILMDGQPQKISDIHMAEALGIGTVFQENSLVPHLTVAENIFLTREPRTKGGLINYSVMNREAQEWGKRLGIDLNPRAKVRTLSVAEQQIVEIVKVFSQNPRLIVLDEPTSSLSDKEIRRLFTIVNRMKNDGMTFIYISHRMEEIHEIGDGGTILRDGKHVKTLEDVKNVDMNTIVKYLVGREITQQYPERNVEKGDVVFEVQNLTVPGLIENISFQVRSGEVMGFSGLVGSGRTETAKAIFGVYRKSAGEVVLDGEKLDVRHPKEAIRSGIGLLPENRKEEGLFLEKPISWNISFAKHKNICKGRLLNFEKERQLADKYVKNLQIRTPDINQAVKYLSGGNQQKVVFAKWLSAGAKLYIFDEPTRGIDVGAKREIYEMINELAAQGHAIIVISSDLPEVLGVSDTIAIFYEGHLVKIIDREHATQEKIMHYAMGGKDNGE